MKKIVFLLAIFLQLGLFAQKYDSNISYAHYKGVIGEKYHFTMDLKFKDGEITGFYSYDVSGGRIFLNGTISPSGEFEMTESVDDKTTGFFSGAKQGQELSGVWQNSEKTKRLHFTAKEDYSHSAHLKYLSFNEKVRLIDTSDIAFCKIYGYIVVPTTAPSRAAYSKILQNIKPLYFGKNLVSDDWNDLLENYVRQIAKDYQDLDMSYDEVLGDEFAWNWEENFTADVVFNQNDFLIIRMANSSYEGGAHGMFTVDYAVFDLQTGERWYLDDIILKSKTEKLGEILYKKVDPMSLFDPEDRNLYASDIFYFTTKKITFVYNPYDVGPWSAGVIEATVKYDEIKEFLTEKFKKRMGIK